MNFAKFANKKHLFLALPASCSAPKQRSKSDVVWSRQSHVSGSWPGPPDRISGGGPARPWPMSTSSARLAAELIECCLSTRCPRPSFLHIRVIAGSFRSSVLRLGSESDNRDRELVTRSGER
jgi:hypothetical protein